MKLGPVPGNLKEEKPFYLNVHTFSSKNDYVLLKWSCVACTAVDDASKLPVNTESGFLLV